MNENNPLVLVVDPDPTHQELLDGMLEEHMTVLLAGSAKECLEIFNFKHPDLVILETNIPDMDGYKLCQKLKASSGETGCAIIFLAEAMSLEEKMVGYRHGCDDFIVKPFQPEELLTKALRTLEIKNVQKKILQDSSDAMHTALTAMKHSSDMGLILRFMESNAKCHDFEDLGRLLFELLREFSLQGSLLFKAHGGDLFVGCQDDSSDAMQLAMCFDKEKFVTKNNELVINQGNVSLLINNMPVEDERVFSELKDVLGMVMTSVSSRTQSINVGLELSQERTSGLDATIANCHVRMGNVSHNLSLHTGEISIVMDNLVSDIKEVSLSLALSDSQEASLLEVFDKTLDKMNGTYSRITHIEEDFNVVLQELNTLTAKLE